MQSHQLKVEKLKQFLEVVTLLVATLSDNQRCKDELVGAGASTNSFGLSWMQSHQLIQKVGRLKQSESLGVVLISPLSGKQRCEDELGGAGAPTNSLVSAGCRVIS